jgi:hypothetical protein
MEQFLTWDMLKDYTTFVAIVFSIVAVTKNVWLIKSIPTRLWSIIVSFSLLLIVNLRAETFIYWDLVLYFVNAITISLGANGLADMNSNKE